MANVPEKKKDETYEAWSFRLIACIHILEDENAELRRCIKDMRDVINVCRRTANELDRLIE